ncbi:MAG: hypothetical protein ACM3VT_02615 [Solirubrobacterales bacterium]
MSEQREIAVLRRLADVLDALGIPYAIGGSIASSMYGTVRFTRDADIGILSFTPAADRFYNQLKDEFYINELAMQQALAYSSNFSIIHFATAFKIDLFVLGPSEFERQILLRSRIVRLGDSEEGDLCFVSPEDVILLKLRQLSEPDANREEQWDDIQGVLLVQGEALDLEYLETWAQKLNLGGLLDQAFGEAAT